ncbi:2-vinyl bacteriochlorophyllide hydratase [Henriciella sp.]|uniref:2-vinyl bacteriochlorophyllide hydratase n=1 Tax=Henriciella sp. TaxID=1968823 RepID=UPI003C71D990
MSIGKRSLAEGSTLYTPAERIKRDETVWTMVQAVLAPIQFIVFAISLIFVVRYLTSGEGYLIATISICVKTFILYTIMVTGAIWEKVVFGQYLFARAFFWEDVFSMLVLALHTAYLVVTFFALGGPALQMGIALAAYATYAINAGQFILKLRQARLQQPRIAGAGEPA